jgi:hypothetical protein
MAARFRRDVHVSSLVKYGAIVRHREQFVLLACETDVGFLEEWPEVAGIVEMRKVANRRNEFTGCKPRQIALKQGCTSSSALGAS